MIKGIVIFALILLVETLMAVPWESVGASNSATSSAGRVDGRVTKDGAGGTSWSGQLSGLKPSINRSGIRQVILTEVQGVVHDPSGSSTVSGSGVAMCLDNEGYFVWTPCDLRFTFEDYGDEDYFAVEVTQLQDPGGDYGGSTGVLLARTVVSEGVIENRTPYTPVFKLLMFGMPVSSITFDPRIWRSMQERDLVIQNDGPPSSMLMVKILPLMERQSGGDQFIASQSTVRVPGNSSVTIKLTFLASTPWLGLTEGHFLFTSNQRDPNHFRVGRRVVKFVAVSGMSLRPAIFFLRRIQSDPVNYPGAPLDVEGDGRLAVLNVIGASNGHPEDLLHRALNFEIGERLWVNSNQEFGTLADPFAPHEVFLGTRHPNYFVYPGTVADIRRFAQIWSNQHPYINETMVHESDAGGLRGVWFRDRYRWDGSDGGWPWIEGILSNGTERLIRQEYFWRFNPLVANDTPWSGDPIGSTYSISRTLRRTVRLGQPSLFWFEQRTQIDGGLLVDGNELTLEQWFSVAGG